MTVGIFSSHKQRLNLRFVTETKNKFFERREHLEDEDEYKRAGSDQGLVVIFNQETFEGTEVSNREGTRKDVYELVTTLGRLGYNIDQRYILNDLKKKDIIEKIQESNGGLEILFYWVLSTASNDTYTFGTFFCFAYLVSQWLISDINWLFILLFYKNSSYIYQILQSQISRIWFWSTFNKLHRWSFTYLLTLILISCSNHCFTHNPSRHIFHQQQVEISNVSH